VIVPAGGSQPIWRQAAGDHKPLVGAFHHDSMKRLAGRIVKDLREDCR